MVINQCDFCKEIEFDRNPIKTNSVNRKICNEKYTFFNDDR